MKLPPLTATYYYDTNDPYNATIKVGQDVYMTTPLGPRMGMVTSHNVEEGCVTVEFYPYADEE